ncbi:tRNA-Ile-lysidine synthase [Ferriphaselus amnicola]|uniref:tRNA(Ile)-lysidine synthase n=2 Tax=Ferriphaselus amnicola TaxID=1188319 RepID=A0A2Z6GAD4_9PROT|nr:tRNA-Ile-lysidine synthase [Ferriphaselus amnicola]
MNGLLLCAEFPMPADLLNHLSARLNSVIPEGSSICVGLSGGMDSVVLLHLLSQLASRHGWRLSAVHVHHGISPNADDWADFCAALCARQAIPLHIERVDISPLRQHGIEAAARKLRHAAFARQPADLIALAHHADDQAETLLLQLLRGAGIKGVAAMPLFKPASATMCATVRPLLDIARADLLAYAQQYDLTWIEDESNADASYPRNFLRHQVLPLLEQRFPAYRQTLARSAGHFAEASALLDELAAEDASADELTVSSLRARSQPRAKNLLRHYLHSHGAPMPQSVQLANMLRQLIEAQPNAAVCVEFGDGWQVQRYQDRVLLLRDLGAFDPALVLPWQGETELEWPALQCRVAVRPAVGAGISQAKLQRAPVTLRLRSGGESLRPHPNAAKRSLKNLLQERGVPPWRRERLPLLYCGDELVSVVGVAVAAEFQAEEGEAALEFILLD